MAKTKKIKDLEAQTCFNGPNEIETVTINRADIQRRPDLHYILQHIWELRREHIMKSYGRNYPSLVLVSYKTEDDLMQLAYNSNFTLSGLDFFSPCGHKEERNVFNMRLIVSRDIKQDEIVIA